MAVTDTSGPTGKLPDQLAALLGGRVSNLVLLGESGAEVWRFSGQNSPAVYLKKATGSALAEEAARLQWLQGVAPVPAVLGSWHAGDDHYLLLKEIPGQPASSGEWVPDSGAVIDTIADAVRALHEVSIVGCPFDSRTATQLDRARRAVAEGRVKETDFDAHRRGRTARELLAELERTAPATEDLVVTHGDLSLPNVILDRDAAGGVVLSGFVDCGRAGIADRYQDLALAVRSIAYNFGDEWVAPFFQRYGMTSPDSGKIAFYQLLDEFF